MPSRAVNLGTTTPQHRDLWLADIDDGWGYCTATKTDLIFNSFRLWIKIDTRIIILCLLIQWAEPLCACDWYLIGSRTKVALGRLKAIHKSCVICFTSWELSWRFKRLSLFHIIFLYYSNFYWPILNNFSPIKLVSLTLPLNFYVQ